MLHQATSGETIIRKSQDSNAGAEMAMLIYNNRMGELFFVETIYEEKFLRDWRTNYIMPQFAKTGNLSADV